MASELKPWKYEIKYGPEGEDAYSWVYDDRGAMVATMKTHKAKEIVERMNTPVAPVSPDATGKCGELVTYRPSYTIERLDCGPVTKAIMEEHKDGKYVTRSQADELLAAKDDHIAWLKRQLEAAQGRARNAATNSAKFEELLTAERVEKEKWKVRGDQHWDTLRSIREMAREGDCERIILWVNDAGSGYTEPLEATVKSLSDKALALEADNAALTARVEELDQRCEDWSKSYAEKCSDYEALKRRTEALANYAREATKAITSLTGGGSENFGKAIGDFYPVDLSFCLGRIRERYVSKVELKRLEAKLAAAEKALEAIAALSATDMSFGDQVFAVTSARAALGGKPS